MKRHAGTVLAIVLLGLNLRTVFASLPPLLNDVRDDPHYAVTPETVDVRAELVAPLLVEGRVWGAINLEELVEDSFRWQPGWLYTLAIDA